MPWFTRVARIAAVLTLIVVVLGAFVRLSDAGLGCPDWPGCYGRLLMANAEMHAVVAEESGFERPYEHEKAWKEMIHRYLAGLLGLLIATLAVLAWRHRRKPGQPVAIPLALVALVLFQSALGMWTVTLLLKPAVVVAHLLGGMSILALLWWLVLRAPDAQGRWLMPARTQAVRGLFPWALAAIVVIAGQITLGGWVSANYAALICADFPTCQGQWWPAMDFRDGFTFWREVGVDYEGGVLAPEAMKAVHMMHRVGAVIALLVVGAAALVALASGSRALRMTGLVLLVILLLQIGLGIANIIWMLPLSLAVAHNAGAALLLLTAVTLLHQSSAQSIVVRE
jgi:heme a synthase